MKKPKQKQKPLIILTAGGTGGHVYPAEALAEELAARGYRLMLVTDKRGKDNYKGKLGEIPNVAVFSGGVVGKSKLFKIKSLIKTALGIVQAIWVLWRQKPLCVVGFGGYASFPACMAAILSGTRLIIHEQNSVMSRTNRFLSKYADLVGQSFRKVKYAPEAEKCLVCGMPVRAAIVAAADLPYPKLGADDKMQILVLGGSQGAKVFGDVVPQAVQKLDKKLRARLNVFQQCRSGEENEIAAAYEGSGVVPVIKHFFDNMPELYRNSHLVISRSGASSVSEIAVVGVPSVLVPLPTAADDHQTSNAAEIAEAKAGVVIRQVEFLPEKLQKLIADLAADYPRLKQMSENAAKAGIKNAAKRLADGIEKILAKK